MPAHKNNKYAEKWDKKTALKFMNDALKLLHDDVYIMYIGTLANRQNSYKDIYTYLTNKFKDDKEFRTIKKKIDSIIESRLYEAALKNKVNAAVAIFGLKNNHKWKDKREQEVILPDLKNITPLTFYKNEENEN